MRATGKQRAQVAARFGIDENDVPDRPADTGTHTFVVSDDAGGPVWTARPWTDDELAARTQAATREAQRTTAKSWLADLSAWAKSDTAGDDPAETALAVILTVEATAVLLSDEAL